MTLEESFTKRTQNSLTKDFYVFDRGAIHQATTQLYREFLREGGYADFDTCSGLAVAKKILCYDQSVKDLGFSGINREYVVNINHTDSKRLVEGLDGKLLTTKLMYSLFIPSLKYQTQAGNEEAQATLQEMIHIQAEWLEDQILNKNKLKIGTGETPITPLNKDGNFDRTDLDEYGYPTQVNNQGEFCHWQVVGNHKAAIRDADLRLGLNLGWNPSFMSGRIGVRLTKIIP